MVNEKKNIDLRKSIIVFDVGSVDNWIGGVYYIKNIIFSILQSDKIQNEFSIFLFLDKKYEEVFEVFGERIERWFYRSNSKIKRYKEFKQIVDTYNCRYIYNYQISKYGTYEKRKGVFWIADFQHKYFPTFFSKREIIIRDIKYKLLAMQNNTLILSSQNAFSDFKKFYPESKAKVEVVHFVSYIEEELKSLSKDYEDSVLKRHKLERYIYIPNQFWQHKNHIVVLEAVKKIVKTNKLTDFKFVFTGELKDYRNLEYYGRIKKLMEDEDIKDRILNLGFINRKEQLAIMKNAKLIVQPSLFEGWGTVLEDAKVLDKHVLLSDIPVHREQMNGNCVLFNPLDSNELADLLVLNSNVAHEDNIEMGINNMYLDARLYAKKLEKVFNA